MRCAEVCAGLPGLSLQKQHNNLQLQSINQLNTKNINILYDKRNAGSPHYYTVLLCQSLLLLRSVNISYSDVYVSRLSGESFKFYLTSKINYLHISSSKKIWCVLEKVQWSVHNPDLNWNAVCNPALIKCHHQWLHKRYLDWMDIKIKIKV